MQFNFVISTNRSAVHLWRQLGFETSARCPALCARKGLVDAYVMFRLLDET
jgi:hypothetical protein